MIDFSSDYTIGSFKKPGQYGSTKNKFWVYNDKGECKMVHEIPDGFAIGRKPPTEKPKPKKRVYYNLAVDKNGNVLGKVKLDDPRWKTKEIVKYFPANENIFLHAGDSITGNYLGKIVKSDRRWTTGEIKRMRPPELCKNGTKSFN